MAAVADAAAGADFATPDTAEIAAGALSVGWVQGCCRVLHGDSVSAPAILWASMLPFGLFGSNVLVNDFIMVKNDAPCMD